LELFGALEVFREGAENRTRGACAPLLNFGFRVEFTFELSPASSGLLGPGFHTKSQL
jgi:hypothetical protein